MLTHLFVHPIIVSFTRSVDGPSGVLDLYPEKPSSPAATGSLTTSEILSYAVGHVGNDLSAACWFTYMRKYSYYYC